MPENKTTLRAISLKVKDVLGVEEYAIEPGNVTILSGQNGSGKTTMLESIKSLLGGGDLSKLARIGDEGEDIEPEIVMVLESSDGQKIIVQKNNKGTRIKAQVGDSAAFEDVPHPARFLKGIYDGNMSNPLRFIQAPNYSKDPNKLDRIRILLGALPVELDRDQLWQDMGIKPKDISPVPTGLHPLQEMELIREAIMLKRKGINTDAKSKAGSAEQMRRNIPAVLPEGHESEIEDLDKSISDKDKEITERTEKAKSKCELGCNASKSDFGEKSQEVTFMHENWASAKRADLEKKIAKQRSYLEKDISEELDETNSKIAELIEDRDSLCATFQKERDAAVDKALEDQSSLETERTNLIELREAGKAAIAAKALHEQAEQFDTEAKWLKDDAATLTCAIDALDKRRRKMADNLPIKGLAVVGKEIQLDGIPYDQLNTAKQMKLAVQIACLRSHDHEFPMVRVDGAEALDKENFDYLVKYLGQENVQAFIANRTEGSLTTTVSG